MRRLSVDRALDDLGRRIAELRHERGWTQQQAADRLGVPLRDWQKLEGGVRNITVRTLVGLANVLGVEMAELFTRPGSREPRRAGRPRAAERPRARGV